MLRLKGGEGEKRDSVWGTTTTLSITTTTTTKYMKSRKIPSYPLHNGIMLLSTTKTTTLTTTTTNPTKYVKAIKKTPKSLGQPKRLGTHLLSPIPSYNGIMLRIKGGGGEKKP